MGKHHQVPPRPSQSGVYGRGKTVAGGPPPAGMESRTDATLTYDDFVANVFGYSPGIANYGLPVKDSGLDIMGIMPRGMPGVRLERFPGGSERPGGYPSMGPPDHYSLQATGKVLSGVSSLTQAMAKIADLPEDQMNQWKQALYDSGIYNPAMYSKKQKPRMNGILDTQDKAAFEELMYTSLTAPRNLTVQQVLERMKKDNPYSKENNFGEGPRAPSNISVSVSDPATVRRYARSIATELLGRDLDDKTLNSLANKIIAEETGGAVAQGQRALASAASEQDTLNVNQQYDVAARTEEAIMAANPAEIEAKKFAGGFDVLMSMLQGGVG